MTKAGEGDTPGDEEKEKEDDEVSDGMRNSGHLL